MGAFGIQNETQLGFGDLLAEADAENTRRAFDRQTAHLPDTMPEGIAYFRDLIERHHVAMLIADEMEVAAIREEARHLARKLNGGDVGILAHEDASGYVLARETAADEDQVPLWGQTGSFVIEVCGVRFRIEMEGLFGIGSHSPWLGFSAHAVDLDRPFVSDTGYRSFLGAWMEPTQGIAPDIFAAEIITAYVRRDLKGHLVKIHDRYRRTDGK